MTTVEWLINEIDMQYPHINIRWKQIMIEQAIEMEKQQMHSFWKAAIWADELCSNFEEYYKETYKKDKL